MKDVQVPQDDTLFFADERAENSFVYCNMETISDCSDAENNLQINRFHQIFILPSEARSSFQ